MTDDYDELHDTEQKGVTWFVENHNCTMSRHVAQPCIYLLTMPKSLSNSLANLGKFKGRANNRVVFVK
jgi:hypothetical protein